MKCLEARGWGRWCGELKRKLIITDLEKSCQERDKPSKALTEYTYEDVKRLRLMGRGDEADKILKTFRADVKKNKEQLKKEIRRDYNMIHRVKNKNRIKHYVHSENATFSEEKTEVDKV